MAEQLVRSRCIKRVQEKYYEYCIYKMEIRLFLLSFGFCRLARLFIHL